jgi:MFS transporter, ACS family, D-galactonate transporter
MAANLRGWKLLFLLCLANVMAYIGVFELPPIIGNLVHDFHISYAQAGLFMSVYALVRMIGSLMAGVFSDRYGVKRFVFAGLVLVGLGGFFCAHSHGFVSMLVYRTIIGIGATLIFIPGLAAAMYLVKPDQVNLATGTFFTSMNLGLTVALFFTPIIAASSSWRTPLNLFAGLTGIIAVVFFAVTRGQTLQASGDVRLANPRGEHAIGTYSIHNVPLVLISIGYFMMLFHTYGMITWLPEYLKVARGYSPAQVGTVSMVLGLVMIPGTFIAGWLGDRVGAWGIGMIGVVLCGACPAAFVVFPGLSLAAVFAGVSLLAFGICLLIVPLTSILSSLVPAKDNGKAVGLIHTTGYAGSVASTYLGGYLLTLTGSYTWPFALYVGSMIICLFIFLAMYRYYAQAASMRAVAAVGPQSA